MSQVYDMPLNFQSIDRVEPQEVIGGRSPLEQWIDVHSTGVVITAVSIVGVWVIWRFGSRAIFALTGFDVRKSIANVVRRWEGFK